MLEQVPDDSRTGEREDGTDNPSQAGLFSLLALSLEESDFSSRSVIAVIPLPAAPLDGEASCPTVAGEG